MFPSKCLLHTHTLSQQEEKKSCCKNYSLWDQSSQEQSPSASLSSLGSQFLWSSLTALTG